MGVHAYTYSIDCVSMDRFNARFNESQKFSIVCRLLSFASYLSISLNKRLQSLEINLRISRQYRAVSSRDQNYVIYRKSPLCCYQCYDE